MKKSFIENHFFVSLVILFLIIVLNGTFVFAIDNTVVALFCLLTMTASSVCLARLWIWKTGNTLIFGADPLWQILRFQKKENLYRDKCLARAKILFIISIVLAMLSAAVVGLFLV